MNRRKFTVMLATIPLVGWVAARFSPTAVAKNDNVESKIAGQLTVCDRCRKPQPITPVIRKPTGMTWFTPHSSDFATSSGAEQVCGGCLTDREITSNVEISRLMDYVLSYMLQNNTHVPTAVALENVRAYFVVYNSAGHETRLREGRKAALRAMGLYLNT